MVMVKQCSPKLYPYFAIGSKNPVKQCKGNVKPCFSSISDVFLGHEK